MSSAEHTMTGAIVPDPPGVPGLVFRQATDADWDSIADLMNRARNADGVDEMRSGADLRAEYEPLDAFDLGRDLLIAEIDGAPVGVAFGFLVEREGVLVAETWGVVAPERRRKGIGTAMWRWNRDRLAVQAATHPCPGPREMRTYALDTEHSDLALIADQGYLPIRYGFEMRRFLSGTLPMFPMPDGLELRPVLPEHHRAIFDADNEAFEDHWGHRPQTDGDFVVRFESPEVNTGLWSIAWDGDRVAGVVMTAIFREENEAFGVRRGWLEHVSVRRPWRGRGLAKALCTDAFRVLREQGMDEAWLGVDGTNPTGALGLYESLGFQVARRWQAYGRPLDRTAPAGWTSGALGDRE
jgi:mycothiol synthase